MIMPYRQVQEYNKASKILRIETRIAASPDLIQLRQLGVAGESMPTDITVDAGEFAKELDGCVPGFHASYDPNAVVAEAERLAQEDDLAAHRKRIAEAELLLKSNGYEVTKQPDPGAEYIAGIAEFANTLDTTRHVEVLPSQGAHHLHEVLQRAAYKAGRNQLKDVEVYVEIDRALLSDTLHKALEVGVEGVWGDEIFTLLWPVVARIDEQNDVILHVTSGDRAQNGKGDR